MCVCVSAQRAVVEVYRSEWSGVWVEDRRRRWSARCVWETTSPRVYVCVLRRSADLREVHHADVTLMTRLRHVITFTYSHYIQARVCVCVCQVYQCVRETACPLGSAPHWSCSVAASWTPSVNSAASLVRCKVQRSRWIIITHTHTHVLNMLFMCVENDRHLIAQAWAF